MNQASQKTRCVKKMNIVQFTKDLLFQLNLMHLNQVLQCHVLVCNKLQVFHRRRHNYISIGTTYNRLPRTGSNKNVYPRSEKYAA